MTPSKLLTVDERERLSEILDRINQAQGAKAKAIQEQESAESDLWRFVEEVKAGAA